MLSFALISILCITTYVLYALAEYHLWVCVDRWCHEIMLHVGGSKWSVGVPVGSYQCVCRNFFLLYMLFFPACLCSLTVAFAFTQKFAWRRVISEAATIVTLRSAVFWFVTPYNLVQWNTSVLATVGTNWIRPSYRSTQLMETTRHCENWTVHYHSYKCTV